MIGTELLLGEITDTNARYLARRLADIGIDLYHKTTVGDNWLRMSTAMGTALERSDILIVSGGLGPTQDDLTKEVLAATAGRPLYLHTQAWDNICAYLRGRGRPITDNNQRQAMIPQGAELIPNPVGVAPGIWLELGKKLIICLPGVPDELTEMMESTVIPRIRQTTHAEPLHSRVLRFRGIGESALETELLDLIERQTSPTLAMYAGSGEVRIRLTCRAVSTEAADKLFQPIEDEIRRRLGDYLHAVGDRPVEQLIGDALTVARGTLATAESCTGGLIGHRITSVRGSSSYFQGSVVAYANSVKTGLLGVPNELLATYGAVSREVAQAMAEGVRTQVGADWGLSITGIAGPTGGSKSKPVGTVYIGCACAHETVVIHRLIRGSRDVVKRRSTDEALWLLYNRLHERSR